MAVQAQYPSNLLFHDRGDLERNKDMDMPRPPPQLAGLSPAAVYFSTAGANGNRRKRPRESIMPAPAPKEEYVNLFTLQTQQSMAAPFQSQNRVSPSPSPAATALVSTGLRLAFDEEQGGSKQMMNAPRSYSSPSPASLFASVSDELAAQVKQHDDEIDRFIREQGEQLRRAMADRLRRHNRAILLKADQSSSAFVDPRRAAGPLERACVGCRLRPASVVLLPCRHLSLCGECFAAGDADAAMACPVCLCVRTGSVEAILC